MSAITAQLLARHNLTTFTGVLWEQDFSVGSHKIQNNAFKSLKGLCAALPSCGKVTLCAVLKHGFFCLFVSGAGSANADPPT